MKLPLSGLLLFGMVAVTSASPDYGTEIQPLLAEHCYACHGPDAKERKAGLRFDERDVATEKLKSGSTAIVPGDADVSEMIRRLFSDDPDEMMPPPEFRKRPTAEAKEKLRQWVADGANYEKHWAFEPIRKPAPPEVMHTDWPRNEIDRFILARLEKDGMRPSPEANRTTLVRRLSLDFRGLPLSLGEIAKLDPDSAVDAMLGSKHYGERMAQDWLDLARYGDTNGYHSDSNRDMWIYRDYVIDSFNRNKPFDRFIIENMAGDLLPEPTEESRVASGFHRCVTFNEEGGADPDEFYVTYAVDRANTTGQVFLGLTVGCAQCHDHKYDPISQKEYYQLYAFFNSVEGEIGAGGRSGYHNKPLPPLLKVKTDDLRMKLADYTIRIQDAEKRLAEAKARPEFVNADGPLAGKTQAWAAKLREEQPTELAVTNGLQLHLDAAQVTTKEAGVVSIWNDLSPHHRHAKPTGAPKLVSGALNGKPVVRLDGKNDFLRTDAGGEALGRDFTMIVVLRFNDMKAHQMALMWGEESQSHRRALWKTDKNKLSFNGYGDDVVGSADFKKDQAAIAVVTKEGEKNQIKFFLNGRAGGEGRAGLGPYTNNAITIGANNAGKEKTAAEFAEILVYDRALDEFELAKVGRWLGAKFAIETEYKPAPDEILKLAQKAPEVVTPEERKRLFDFFVAKVHPESRDRFQSLEAELKKLNDERRDAEKKTPTTMVMVEMKKRKPARILMRGDFQQPGEEVEPDVPAIFPRLPGDQPRNRLGLAHWLVDPKNPLVARVFVNRIWKQFFGTGLVKTLGDFGTQGERPSHPELLDWLAADFVEHGWDIQRLQRLIVNSATYRQSSVVHGDQYNVDPENRLLARGSRFRLSAEEVRDVALSISGLLDPKIGGPSVMPPQPANYLSSIGKGWKDSTGSDRYRRGLYTFWRRTMLYPTFQIFDAPSREFCTVNRPRTNTPLQALVTMNDPAFFEAARGFGKRILAEGGATEDARLHYAFKLATSRDSSAREYAVLKETLHEQRQIFKNDPESARKLLAEKDPSDAANRAAWITVANILLNLDETITRE